MARLFQCSYCDEFYASRHNLCRHKKTCGENLNHSPGLAKTSKHRAGSEQTMEFVNFTSDEFGPGGVPKTAETLNN